MIYTDHLPIFLQVIHKYTYIIGCKEIFLVVRRNESVALPETVKINNSYNKIFFKIINFIAESKWQSSSKICHLGGVKLDPRW